MSSVQCSRVYIFFFFFFNDTATTEIYTLSLHDALPILKLIHYMFSNGTMHFTFLHIIFPDRKSTRLNSSHMSISYAVFCLKKKKIHLHHLHETTMTLRVVHVQRSHRA